MTLDVFRRLRLLQPRTCHFLFCALLTLGCFNATYAQSDDLVVFAAASTKTAMETIATGFEAKTAHSVALSFGGSASLARQIELGAPADIFVSANAQWMGVLSETGFVRPSNRFDLVENTLVLIEAGPKQPKGFAAPDVATALLESSGYIAMGSVNAVPAGQYGKAALISLGIWKDVQHRVIEADNVRAALTFVALEEASFGIVYATDALNRDDVHIAAAFPQDTHPRIVYPVAAIGPSPAPAAVAFLDYLRGPEAQGVLYELGFEAVRE